MTAETPFDADVTDTDTFESYLGQLLLAANRNSVDVRGAWKFEHGEQIPDMEVVVTHLKSDE